MPIGRVAEHHGGDVLVVQLAVGRAAEQAQGEATAGRDRHRGELGAAGDVADRVDAGHVGVLEGVGGDGALGVGLDAGSGELQAVGVGLAAGGPHQRIHLEAAGLAAVDEHAAVGLALQRARLGAEAQRDAVFLHLRGELVAQHGIEGAQQAIAAHQHGDLAAQAAEHAGELHRDVACADHGDTARLRFEREEAVGVDAELGAGEVGQAGAAAGGDHDVGRGEALTLDLDHPRAGEAGEAAPQLDAGLLQHAGVDAVEALDVGVAALP